MKLKYTVLYIKGLVLSIVFTITISLSQAQTTYNKEIEQRIRQIENRVNDSTLLERMQHYKVPSVSIALINDNKIEWAKAYGTLNSSTGVLATTESFWEAASVTKSLVSALAIHFVDKGLLELDVDVNTYLNSWKIPENEFTEEKKVTLRLLLSHQAGMTTQNVVCTPGSTPSLLQVLKGESPAVNQAAVVEYVPGTSWGYSNMGYVVIQQLLEDLTAKPLPLLMKQVIFDPLEMTSSTMTYPLAIEQQKNEAMPHFANGEVGEPYMHPSALGHAGLMTTSADLAKFTIELMNAYHGKSNILLSQKMAHEMFNKEKVTLDPSFFQGMPFSQGLGVFLIGEKENLLFSHTGGNYPGVITILEGFPNLGKGVVVMTNGASGYPLILEILSAIEKEYNWPNFEKEKSMVGTQLEEASLPDENLKQLIGVYELNPTTTLTISLKGKRVFADYTGRGSFEINKVAEDKYNVPGFGIEVTFIRENDIVSGLDFSSKGNTYYAKKIK